MTGDNLVVLLSREQLIEQLNIQIALLLDHAADSGDYNDYAPQYTRLQIVRDILENNEDIPNHSNNDGNPPIVDLSAPPYTDQVYHSGFWYPEGDFRMYADRDLLRGDAPEQLAELKRSVRARMQG